MTTPTTNEAPTMTTNTDSPVKNDLTVPAALCIIDTHTMKLGAGSVADSEKYVAAYQFLIDTAVVSFLKEGYRAAAAELIAGGFCILPQD